MADDLRWFHIFDWSGGLNDWASEYALASNEASYSINKRLGNRGMLRNSFGWTAMGQYFNGAQAGLHRGYSSELALEGLTGSSNYSATQLAASFLLCASNDLAYSATGATFTKMYDIPNICPTMRAVQWRNGRLYIWFPTRGDPSNGNQAMTWGLNTNADSAGYLYNMAIPTFNKPTFDSSGSGATVATGYYCIAVSALYGPYNNGIWAESVASARSNAYNHTVATQPHRMQLAAAPGSNRIKGIRVYCTEPQTTADEARAATMYWAADFAADTNFHTWDDTHNPIDYETPAPTSDDTGSIIDIASNGKIRCMVAHNDRMWMIFESYPDRLYYSNAGNPDEVRYNAWIRLAADCTGLMPFLGELIIFTEPEAYSLRGYTPDDFQMSLSRVIGDKGNVGIDALAIARVEGRQMLFHVAREGIYAFDGSEDHYVGQNIQGTFDYMSAAQRTALRAVVHGDRYRLANPADDTVLDYDSQYNSWWKIVATSVAAWAAARGAADEGDLYRVDNATGYLQKENPAAYPDVTATYRTGFLDLGNSEYVKELRQFQIKLDVAALPVTITVYREYDGDSKSITLTTAPTGATYLATISSEFPQGLKARRFKFEITTDTGTNSHIVGLSIGWRVVGTGRA